VSIRLPDLTNASPDFIDVLPDLLLVPLTRFTSGPCKLSPSAPLWHCLHLLFFALFLFDFPGFVSTWFSRLHVFLLFWTLRLCVFTLPVFGLRPPSFRLSVGWKCLHLPLFDFLSTQTLSIDLCARSRFGLVSACSLYIVSCPRSQPDLVSHYSLFVAPLFAAFGESHFSNSKPQLNTFVFKLKLCQHLYKTNFGGLK
jgi:hypothetical protein